MLTDIKQFFEGEATVWEQRAHTHRIVASLTQESPEYRFALTVINAMDWYESLRGISRGGLGDMLRFEHKYRNIPYPTDWFEEKFRVIRQIVTIDYPSVHIVWYGYSSDLGDVLCRIIETQSNPRQSRMFGPQQRETTVCDGIVMGQPIGYS